MPTSQDKHGRGHVNVVSVMVKKGGVAKTTIAVNMAACLHKLGKRVLVIDLDSQFNATSRLSAGPANKGRAAGDGIVKGDLYSNPDNYYIATKWQNPSLDLMPSNASYSLVESEATSDDHLVQLKLFIDHNGHRWDWIIIDCPNNFHALTVSAFLASDGIIIPVDLNDDGSVRAIETVLSSIKEVRRSNQKLSLWGIAITKNASPTSLASTTLGWIKDEYKLGGKIFKTRISKSQYVSNANAYCEPAVFKYPNHAFVKEFYELTKEVMQHGK